MAQANSNFDVKSTVMTALVSSLTTMIVVIPLSLFLINAVVNTQSAALAKATEQLAHSVPAATATPAAAPVQTCAAPVEAEETTPVHQTSATQATYSAPAPKHAYHKPEAPKAVVHTTNNTVHNTVVDSYNTKVTQDSHDVNVVIKDSFNKNSNNNTVIKDSFNKTEVDVEYKQINTTVNSHNTVNSNNKVKVSDDDTTIINHKGCKDDDCKHQVQNA